MLILLSPSKSMESGNLHPDAGVTEVLFDKKSKAITKILSKFTPSKLSNLLEISQSLSEIVYQRYQQFLLQDHDRKYSQAIFTFTGDAYESMQPNNFQVKDLEFAQNHLRIISALYGYLRPLDLILPYRLEMETGIQIGKHQNLYSYWKSEIRKALEADMKTLRSATILNLASAEYAKSINFKKLPYKVISPVFLDTVNGTPKIVSIFAKKARGSMTDFVIRNQISDPEYLQAFNGNGYIFDARQSTTERPVFIR
ncbi:MAG: YaaA family protein [Bacteroidales bacterium]